MHRIHPDKRPDITSRAIDHQNKSKAGRSLPAVAILQKRKPKVHHNAEKPAQLQAAQAENGIIQFFGAIRFANLDTSKPAYVEKSNDIIDTLRNTPIVQNFLANKNMVFFLETNITALATVRVSGEQVQVRISPWFFEQESRGKIIGLLVHELGVHPIADELLTAPEKLAEQQGTTNRTAYLAGLGTDTIAYDGDNQADHIFTALAGMPRYNVYQQTAHEIVSRMINNQANTHITNNHITDTIMSYLADVAMILATSDHKGMTAFHLDKTAQYFNHVRLDWLAYLGGKPLQVQITNLTPPVKTGTDVFKEVASIAGSFSLSMFTSSRNDEGATQTNVLGVPTPLTQNQTDVLADHNLVLQPLAVVGSSPKFMRAIDEARGLAIGQTAIQAVAQIQHQIHIQNIQNPLLATLNGQIQAIQNNTITGVPDTHLVNTIARVLHICIRVMEPNGRMETYGNGATFTLVEIWKPGFHYRHAL
jgi:hypothetical protein